MRTKFYFFLPSLQSLCLKLKSVLTQVHLLTFYDTVIVLLLLQVAPNYMKVIIVLLRLSIKIFYFNLGKRLPIVLHMTLIILITVIYELWFMQRSDTDTVLSVESLRFTIYTYKQHTKQNEFQHKLVPLNTKCTRNLRRI